MFLEKSTRFTDNEQVIKLGPGVVELLLAPDGQAFFKALNVEKVINSEGQVINIDNSTPPRLDTDWQYAKVGLLQERTLTIPATHDVVKEVLVPGDVTDHTAMTINLDNAFREWLPFSYDVEQTAPDQPADEPATEEAAPEPATEEEEAPADFLPNAEQVTAEEPAVVAEPTADAPVTEAPAPETTVAPGPVVTENVATDTTLENKVDSAENGGA